MKKFDLKSLFFRVTFNGNGCVNFDDAKQKEYLFAHGVINSNQIDYNANNVNFAKKVFFGNKFLYKVSSKCIRHAIFDEEIPFEDPKLMQLPKSRCEFLTSKAAIIRGYLSADKVGGTIKMKSSLSIPDAIEVGEKREDIAFDFHSRSGSKKPNSNNSSKEEKESKDTSIYQVENVGVITYQTEGFINLQELQFISADPTYDRMGVLADGGPEEEIYLDLLRKKMYNFDGDLGYYYIKKGSYQDEWAERGILFNNDTVDDLVKHTLRCILDLAIGRASAFLKTTKLEVSVDKGKTYFEIIEDDLDNMYFNVIPKYLEADEEKIRKNKEKLEEIEKKKKEIQNSNKTKSKSSNNKSEE